MDAKTKTQPATHTPTPWLLDDEPTSNGTYFIQADVDRDSEFCALLETCNVRDDINQRANAAFIVRAVNSHDAMRAALRACLETMEEMNVLSELCGPARAALKLAEEE